MRIIAGKHRGRNILLPKHHEIRPTSDFARQGIFNILSHGVYEGMLDGATVADLFAGCGTFGLEALSRGAKAVMFVENHAPSLAAIRETTEKFGEASHCQFLHMNATRLPHSPAPYSLVFLDPPYHRDLLVPALNSLLAQGWLNKDTIIVAEHDQEEKIALPEAFKVQDERRYGRALLKILKLAQ